MEISTWNNKVVQKIFALYVQNFLIVIDSNANQTIIPMKRQYNTFHSILYSKFDKEMKEKLVKYL
jgi:hypothetical protein